jgi:6-phosphogluconolactonase (cycloisomerase 2 family)
MRYRMSFGSLRLITALAFAVLPGLSGCGSGHGGMAPPPPAAMAYLYVTATADSAGGAGAVYEYAVLSDLSVVPLSQASIAAGVNPAALVVDKADRHVYVVNVGDGTISQYNIEVDNTLSPMTPAVVSNPGMKTLGVLPSAAILGPTGNMLYVANSADNSVSQFSIGSGGQLIPLTPAAVATGVQPMSLVTALPPNTGVANLYVANSGGGVPGTAGSVSQFAIGLDGSLTSLNPATVAAGASPVAIATVASTVYVMGNCSGTQCAASITQFSVGSGGELTATGAQTTTADHYNNVNMVTDQGNHAYLLSNFQGVDTANGALWQFNFDSSGALTAANPPMISLGPVALAQTLGLSTLYVLTASARVGGAPASGGGINIYTMGTVAQPTSGQPTLIASASIAPTHPVSIGVQILLAP